MECNKDEAVNAKELAEKKFHQNDIDGALRLALKAQNLYHELDGISKMVATLRVIVAARVRIGQDKDWYAVLSVDPSAKADVVRKQYKKMALILHPDKNKSLGADVAFKLVSEAFNVLSDKIKRQAFDYNRRLRASQQRKGPQPEFGSNASINQKNTSISTSTVDDLTDSPPTVAFDCSVCGLRYIYLENAVNQSICCPSCKTRLSATKSETFAGRASPSDSSAPQKKPQQQQDEMEKQDRKVTSTREDDPSSILGVDHAASTDPSMQMRHGFHANTKSTSDHSKDVRADPSPCTADSQPFNKMENESEKDRKSKKQPEKEVRRELSDPDNRAGGICMKYGSETHKSTYGPAASHPDQQPTVTNKMKGDFLSDFIMVKEAPPSNSSSNGTASRQDRQPTAVDKTKNSTENSTTDCTSSYKDINFATSGHQKDMPHRSAKSKHKEFSKLGSRNKTARPQPYVGSDNVTAGRAVDPPKMMEQKPTTIVGEEGGKLPENERRERKETKRLPYMIPTGGFIDERKTMKYRLISTLYELTATTDIDTTTPHVPISKCKVSGSKSERNSNNKTQAPIPFPDSDFYDCDKDRCNSSFMEGQIWAVYDNNDGMPRLYVLIQEVFTSIPFKIRMAFLSCRTPQFGTAINLAPQPRFSSGCGNFQIEAVHKFGEDCLAMFSHQTHWEKLSGGGGEVFQIIPHRGDVWVLYKNWSPDWGNHQQDVACEYEVVQVMEEYSKERGVMVMPLVKLRGYNSVFCRALELKHQWLVPSTEMPRFSHRAPALVLTSKEGAGALEGCLQLDPAAMPLHLLVDAEGNNPLGKPTGCKQQRNGKSASYSWACTPILCGSNKKQKTVLTPMATGVLV